VLTNYGLKIGLGFQISDDMLDISATSEELGKTAGKDAQQGKVTYPALIGVKESAFRAEKLASEAISLLDIFGERAGVLRQLAIMLLNRSR